MEEQPESITLTGENGDSHTLYVLEGTVLNEKNYLLLAESPAGDSDAYIFREEPEDSGSEETVYVPVTDETELAAVGKIFEELLDDTDFD